MQESDILVHRSPNIICDLELAVRLDTEIQTSEAPVHGGFARCCHLIFIALEVLERLTGNGKWERLVWTTHKTEAPTSLCLFAFAKQGMDLGHGFRHANSFHSCPFLAQHTQHSLQE